MRTAFLLPITGLAVFLTAAPAARAQGPAAKGPPAFALPLDALGDPARLRKVKGVHLECRSRSLVVFDKSFYRWAVTWHAPDRWRLDVPAHATVVESSPKPLPLEARTVVVNGRRGWQREGARARPLEDWEVKGNAENYLWLGLAELTPLAGEGFAVADVGPAEVKGRPATCLRATAKSGRQIKLYFDRGTRLLAKAEYKGWNLFGPGGGGAEGGQESYRAEWYFGDYRESDGLRHWRRAQFYLNGRHFEDVEVTAVRYLGRVDEALFRQP